MDVSIIQFRGIKNWQSHFDNGLTLLKGESGSGKSTILEAIRWCLFGQLRQVFPFSGEKNTEVTISFDNITITRKKNPEIIKWTNKDIILEGTAAEKQIDNYFGSKMLWQAGSYIQQGEKIILLSGSSNEKSNLIKEIVFSGQEEKSQQLIHIFKEKSQQLEKANHGYLYTMEYIQKNKNNYNQDNNELLAKIKPNFYESKLYQSKEILINKLEEINNNIKANQEQIIINNLLDEKNKLLLESQENIKKYPPQLDQQKFTKWLNYIKWKEEINNYDIEDVTIEEDLDTLLELNIISINNKEILNKYNIDEKNIKKELDNIKHNIDNYYEYDNYKEKLKIYNNYQNNINKYKNYLEQLNKLEDNIKKNWLYVNQQLNLELEIDIENIKNLEYKLRQCKEGFLKCPNCEKALTLKDNCLIEKDIVLEDKIISKIEKVIINIKSFLTNKKECEEKIKILSENEPDKPEEKTDPGIKDIDLYKQKQIKLSQYQHLECDNIIEKISILKKREKINELNKLMEKNYYPFFDEYNIEDEYYFNNYIILKNNITECQNYINNHENKKILDLAKEEKLISRIEEKLDIIKEQEEIYNIKQNIEKYEKEYEEEKEKYEKTAKEIKLCQKFISIIQHSENESFVKFINYFNTLTNEILTILFENCYIKIKPFKENDKTKTVKAQLDFNIFIDGNKYDNWHVLSGGEKDRVSLAMTLAFNYLKNNKILLLDECMASLDVTNREKCLKAIKQYAQNKIVINICHETIEGYYDTVMNY